MATLIRKILLDEAFLSQQDQWNATELRCIADNVHDVRRLQADDANNPLDDEEDDDNDELPSVPDDSLTVLSLSQSSQS